MNNDEFLRFLQPDLLNGGHDMMGSCWQRPTDFMELNVYDSFWESDGSMGGGGVFRDSTCGWVVGFMARGRDGSSFFAEVLAL